MPDLSVRSAAYTLGVVLTFGTITFKPPVPKIIMQSKAQIIAVGV